MFLYPCTCHDDLGFLVRCSELCCDLGDTTFLFYSCLNILCKPTTTVVVLKSGHLDFVTEHTANQPRLHNIGKGIIAYTVCNVVIFTVNIRNRHEGIILTLVLGVTYTYDSVRISIGKIKESTKLIRSIKQTFTFNGLIHIQRSPRNIVHDLPLFVVKLCSETNTITVIEITLVILIDRWHDNESCTIIIGILKFQPTDDIMNAPTGSYM